MELLIRQAQREDGAAIAEIYAPYVLETAITFEEVPPTPEEMETRIHETLPRYPYLVGEDGGRVIGYVYASQHGVRASYRWSVNVAVYLAPSHHRRGVGSRLYSQLFSLLESQGYAMAFAGVTLPNAASVGLHESLGFTPVGVYKQVGYKLGAWRDVGWWERPLAQFDEAMPPEPIPWKELPEFESVRVELGK